ncbi:hypothetical protein [uncultured Kordia sp.]|uniref:hypothetical protein n=1 Tax=uncultured Kordia sp. TaxID=507699 RepID=UPI002607339F|nr:hypothetical protein [uncultured Kordia sp.]
MTNNKKPNGCLVGFQRLFSGLMAVLATIFLIIVLIHLTYTVKIQGMTLLVVTVAGFFVLRYLWKKVKRKSSSNKQVIKGVFSDFLRTVIVFVVFSVVIMILGENTGYIIDSEDTEEDKDKTEIVTTTEGGKETRYIVNKQYWKDFDRNWHRMDFKIAESSVTKSRNNRRSYRYTRNFSWGSFYKHMADHDRTLLEHLYTSFSKIQQEKKLNRRKFAELIITSIQDIEYNYIKSTPCNGTEEFPCVGNVRLGIFAPAEFSANLQGDCDSRTVLLFVLLRKFNYKVAVLNSDEYRHSVLAINLPSRGTYKTYNRRKYYFVETTAKGCPIGYLPPKVSNVNYWDFVLVN